MSNKKDTLTFSLTLKTLPVKLDDNKYTLKELTGDGRDDHLEGMKDRMKFNDAGKAVGLNSIKGIQAGLLALCLFDSNDKLVEQDIIITWPASVISKLHDAAQKLSALDKDLEENENAAKKD